MDDMKARLASLLSLQPLGVIAMADLTKAYKQINNERLDFKALGFESLRTLLDAMPDTVQVKYDKKSSDYRVFLVDYEVDKVIEREINNQDQQDLDSTVSTRRHGDQGDRHGDFSVEETRTCGDTKPVNHLRQRPIPTAFRGQNDWDLYIQNIPNGTKESELTDAFKSFRCTRVRIKKRENETSYGFATFRDYSEAEEAYLTLDGMQFKGRSLNIMFAKSSFAEEDEVRRRLEKTTFTTEVTSSRHRKSSDGSVERRATTQPDHLNGRKTEDHIEPRRCHSPLRRDESPPSQSFSSSGYHTSEHEANRYREGGTTPTSTRGRIPSNTCQRENAQRKASGINDEHSSGTAEQCCERKSSVQLHSRRIVQVFPDSKEVDEADYSKKDAGAVANRATRREDDDTERFNPWRQDNWRPSYSTQSNSNTNSEKKNQIPANTKVDKKQSISKENGEYRDECVAEGNDDEEQRGSHENKFKTESLNSLSIGLAPGQPDAYHQCRTEEYSIFHSSVELHEITCRSRNEIRDDAVNRDSEAGSGTDIRDGKDRHRRALSDINRTPDIHASLSESQNDYSNSIDERIETTDIAPPVGEIVDSGSSIFNRNSETEKFENRVSAANSSILSRDSRRTPDITPKRLRIYVRDDVLLIGNILRWTEIYSRDGQHLGKVKYQCKPLVQLKNPSLPEFALSDNIANSFQTQTETAVSNESLSIEAETPSTSNTTVAAADALCGRCCPKIPDTMDVQFLQKMLTETQLNRGFLSETDLPEVLDLIVIHVCDSNHFWASVINPGELMDEYEELFQMMSDIAVKVGPEFRLDKATADAKRAGVLYQETDWCRVWIRSEVKNSEVEVFYVDFGNSEFRSVEDLWVLPRRAWDLRPMVLPFHLTGSLTKTTLFELINTKIKVRLDRSQKPTLDFVVAVKPYKELE